jgi:uncharacterized membrane protein
MLPRALIGDIKPENWLGFIDAIYAIILTLLLIELPSQILDLIKVYEKYPSLHGNILNGFLLTFFGYLSVFIIVYDVWAHHRVVVTEAAINRVNISLGILILFLSSLMPPLYHVFSMLKYESMTGEISITGALSSIYFDARLALYSIGLGTYGCIAFIAAKDLRFFRRLGGVADSRMVALKRLRNSSIAMIIVLLVVGLLSFTGVLMPPMPLVLIALCTHLPVDKLMLQLKRQIIPQ